MTGVTGLIESKKAVVAILMIVSASVMAFLTRMTIEQWMDYTKWIAGFYMSAEGVQTGLGKLGAAMSSKGEEPEEKAAEKKGKKG